MDNLLVATFWEDKYIIKLIKSIILLRGDDHNTSKFNIKLINKANYILFVNAEQIESKLPIREC